jgi:hypothetical protein
MSTEEDLDRLRKFIGEKDTEIRGLRQALSESLVREVRSQPADTQVGEMRRFRCYRPHPPTEYYEQGAANAPDEVQFEGVVFSDGTCAVRWLTQFRSHSIWSSWEDLERIHGHPEYGTVIEWLDGIASP